MSHTSRVAVEAYAGAGYPERPLRVHWRGRRRRVSEVLREDRDPERRCFVVRLGGGPDDTALRLCYDYANDAWSAESVALRPPPPETPGQ